MDEATLVGRAVAGDASAWETIVIANQESVFRLAYLILGDPDEAEDAAQETFLRAWDNLPRFDRSRSLRPWLLRIAANLASNHRRSAGRHAAALIRSSQSQARAASVEDQTTEHARADELWQAVRRLDAADQQMIYLRYFLDLSVAETAEAVQAAEGTVKSRSSRALGRLRTIIEREFPMLRDERAT